MTTTRSAVVVIMVHGAGKGGRPGLDAGIRVGLNSPRAQFSAISLGRNLRAGQDDRKHLEVRHTPIFPKICAELNLGDFRCFTPPYRLNSVDFVKQNFLAKKEKHEKMEKTF